MVILRLLPIVMTLPGCGLIAGLRTDYALDDASIIVDGSILETGDGTDAGSDGTKPEGGAGIYNCKGNFVASCAECPNEGLACTYCQLDGGTALAGSCMQYSNNANCPNPPAGFQDCVCGGPSTCAASTQVCFSGNVCKTCGEKQTDGWGCKNGGVCVAKDGGCF